MCKKCGKKCSGKCETGAGASASQAVAALENIVADLTDKIKAIEKDAKFLTCGHPIMMIQSTDDIALFDIGTGLGEDCWDGWAICDGQTHPKAAGGGNITTPNLIDRFVVSAGGLYAVDDTGGAATVVLTTPNLPAHNHAITDPGHGHSIVDPGHDHAVTDPGHGHGGVGVPHTHTLTIIANGEHNHPGIPEIVDSINDVGSGGQFAGSDPLTYGNSGFAGSHTHSGTADAAAAGVTINDAFTGIDVTNAFTGITANDSATGIVATENTGGATAHENLPPYYALMFVIKL